MASTSNAKKIGRILQKSGVKITARTSSNYMQEVQIRLSRAQKKLKNYPKSNDEDSCVNHLRHMQLL
ncbi:MAG: hypothetical protein ACRC5Q_00780 [Culicoidibacterales bacterium]